VSHVTLGQLAKMTPEQREQRLRGIAPSMQQQLQREAVEVLTAIVNEGLRKK
jgi:hypothetical protein